MIKAKSHMWWIQDPAKIHTFNKNSYVSLFHWGSHLSKWKSKSSVCLFDLWSEPQKLFLTVVYETKTPNTSGLGTFLSPAQINMLHSIFLSENKKIVSLNLRAWNGVLNTSLSASVSDKHLIRQGKVDHKIKQYKSNRCFDSKYKYFDSHEVNGSNCPSS